MRTAAKAPVASCWVVATEADEADADAELALEEAAAEVDEAVTEADAEEPEPEVLVARVAFKVPHFSSLVHVAWPSASLGWLAMHCWKVAWQM
jgi:hypothetical protein